MVGSREKKLVILGPTGAGKATITGCMLFKYGGIDMLTMQTLESVGIGNRDRVYEETANNLKSLKLALTFDTPKNHQVIILDASTALADCAILVLPPDPSAIEEFSTDPFSVAKQLIIVINKMDTINWSEEHFQKVLDRLGYDTENVPVVPISALHGDNVVEKSSKCSWYKGWKRTGQSGFTLLEALDVSLQSCL